MPNFYPINKKSIAKDNEYLFKRIKKNEVLMMQSRGYDLQNLLISIRGDFSDPDSQEVWRNEGYFLNDLTSEQFNLLISDDISIKEDLLEQRGDVDPSIIFSEKIARLSSLYYHPQNGSYTFVFYPTANINSNKKDIVINENNIKPFHDIILNRYDGDVNINTLFIAPEFQPQKIQERFGNVTNLTLFKYVDLLYNPKNNFQVPDHKVMTEQEVNEEFDSNILSNLNKFPIITLNDRIMMEMDFDRNKKTLIQTNDYNIPYQTYQSYYTKYQVLRNISSGSLTHEDVNEENKNIEKEFYDSLEENYDQILQD